MHLKPLKYCCHVFWSVFIHVFDLLRVRFGLGLSHREMLYYELAFQNFWPFIIWSPGLKVMPFFVRLRKSRIFRCSSVILRKLYLLDGFEFKGQIFTVAIVSCGLSVISFKFWIVCPINWPNRDNRAGCTGFDRFARCYR